MKELPVAPYIEPIEPAKAPAYMLGDGPDGNSKASFNLADEVVDRYEVIWSAIDAQR
jgi:hypothetical protein